MTGDDETGVDGVSSPPGSADRAASGTMSDSEEGKMSNHKQMLAAALGICVAMSACTAAVTQKEDMLAAAGFTLLPANTVERSTALASLPPHKFIHQVKNGRVVFVYADPTICDCLYIGDQAAYDRYRANVFAKNLANEQAMTAQINEMNWAPWGPGWWY